MTKTRYQAVCFRCYTCVLARTTSRKAANIAAASHQAHFHHDTAVMDLREAVQAPVSEVTA